MSKNSRAQINSTLDSIAGVCLTIGAVAAGLGLVYLLYIVFGPKLAAMKSMKPTDQQQMLQTIGWAKTALKLGSVALVVGLCIRFFAEETVGLILAVVGGLVYFFGPSALNNLTLGALKEQPIYHAIVNDIASAGLICIVPGILLLVRGIVVRVLDRYVARHELPANGVEDSGQRRVARKPKAYEMCWNMACCNERTRRFCPAWEKRRPCWQIKAGCMCDQDIIKRAFAESEGEREQVRQQTATDTTPKIVLSQQQKAARCRNCTIFLEHQRQKFKIATPLAVVAVGIIYALVYSHLAAALYNVLKGMDRFMSFMTYHHGPDASFATQGHVVTTLAMVCIGVALVSFTLRTLEYLVFDLQI